MVKTFKRINLIFAIKVVLCAVAAIIVLSTWLIQPAMSGEVRDAGRMLVWSLMTGVALAAVCALILGAGPNKISKRS